MDSLISDKKLFGNGMAENGNSSVTWKQFRRGRLCDRFTFWDWFYEIMKITRSKLHATWKAGKIVGFIERSKVSDVLTAYPIGTCLIRFSESELGKF